MYSGRLRSLLAVFVLVCACVAPNGAATPMSEEEVNRLSLKDIRRELAKRGVRCDGCVEREHFRARLVEAIANPAVGEAAPTTSEPSGDSQSPRNEGGSDNKLDPDLIEQLRSAYRKKKADKDDLTAKLRKAGINAHMFDADDVDRLGEFLGETRSRKKPSSRAGSARDKPKKSAAETSPTAVVDTDAISDEM